MNKIFKYRLEVGTTTIAMPRFSTVLTVQVQHEEPCIWARINPAEPLVNRSFRVYGTGHDLGEAADLGQYVGTFQLGGGEFVGHVFEVL